MTITHGTFPSKEYRQTLPGIEEICNKVLQGDEKILHLAIKEAQGIVADNQKNYENHPSITMICNWWNSVANQNLACADVFKVWVWDEIKGLFIAGDYEEPPLTADGFMDSVDVAFFPYKGTTVAIEFHKGQKYNEFIDGWAVNYSVTGEKAEKWGLRKDELDIMNISRIAIEGLQRIPEILANLKN